MRSSAITRRVFLGRKAPALDRRGGSIGCCCAGSPSGRTASNFVLYGHTHHQLVRRFGKVLVINPGSAGDARDVGNGRQLSCAVLDTVTEEVVVSDFPDAWI